MKILIVEDEPLIASDLEITLKEAEYTVVGIAHSGTKALDMISNRNPEMVLLDISLKGHITGIEIAQVLQSKSIPFIYVTSYSDKLTIELAAATLPYGYIIKPFRDRDIVTSIEIAMHRYQSEIKKQFPSLPVMNEKLKIEFSPREYEVLHLLWEGKSNTEISSKIILSVNTVKFHISRIFQKLDVNSRSAAMVKVREIM